MTVTSADVARHAGVSRATVSYVINNTANQSISAATRDNVLRAASELGYRPNPAARSLRTNRGTTVLFPYPVPASGYVSATLIDACAQALLGHGLTLVTDFARYASTADQLDAWLRLHPVAVIDLLLDHDDPVLPALRAAGVTVQSSSTEEVLPVTDHARMSSSDEIATLVRYTQLGHLLTAGYTRIAFVLPRTLPLDAAVETKFLADLRRRAKKAGATLTVSRLALEADALRTFAADTAADPQRAGAVMAFNDEYAIGLLTAFSHYGMRVPDDIAVIGVDDIPLAASVVPALTTIAFDVDGYAADLATSVARIVTGAKALPLPRPQHRLVIRESA